ncbi:MAG TPA: hypothetical protein VGY77_12250 [Gemmataceae bacterium]|nr:hypothetical protein [Gemmataceae bacterium]
MEINIDQFTEAELVDLNRRVVERLRFFRDMRAHQQMLQFKIGDYVVFEDSGGQLVFGVITRYNKKSVSLLADNGVRWTVGPSFLKKVEVRVHQEGERNRLMPPKES